MIPAPGPSPRKKISVVIPLYNHGRYIEEAVQSVVQQSAAPEEIIVVDDGSTDDSAQRMKELCGRHPQIIFWSQPNQGAHHALNSGIHRATGEYVSILNSDDAYAPTRLEECLAVLEHEPEQDAVATGLTFVDDAGTPVASKWHEDARAYFDRTGNLSLALIRDNFFVTTSNLFARRSVFEQVGYFSPLRYTHDLEFSLRLLASGRNVRFYDKPLLTYRIHESNTIREDSVGINVERAMVVGMYLYRTWLRRTKDDEAWAEYLRKVAGIAEERGLDVLVSHLLVPPIESTGANDRFEAWSRDAQFRRYASEIFGAAYESATQAARDGILLQENRRLAAETNAQAAAIGKLEAEIGALNEMIESQRGWIRKLEEAKQWLAGQNDEQKAWIGVQGERMETLQSELAQIKGSIPWRLLTAIGLGNRRR